MKNIIIGIVIGLILGSTIAWAAMRIQLDDGNGNILGTTASPLYITSP
jgi:hypothetical protein